MELEKLVHWRVDREVRKKVIEAGDYDAVPYEDAKCIVIVSEVRCRDESGRECPLGVPTVLLDSQSAQSLLEWRVGMAENGLDRDIELVLRQMCRGERCIATLVYRSLQGKQLREVSCELHLKDVKETSLVADWSWQQLVCTAERHKERGVILVKEGRLQNAFILFSKAFKFLIALEPLELAELPADEHPRVLDLKAKLYNNMAHCQLEARCWEEAAWLAARALALQPRDAKALYRRGAARAALGLHEDAWADLQAALRERPDYTAVELLFHNLQFYLEMSVKSQKPLFRDLTAEDPEPEVTEVESFCVNCHANGVTRLLLTKIPFYKNVVIMSFSCDECGYENNEIQPGGAFADKGVRWHLRVENNTDLDRQVVKSDYTSILIPEVELEIPSRSQKGEVTTVEGIISRTITGLSQDQEIRKTSEPEAFERIESYIQRLNALKDLENGPFTIQIEDISGNCFIENPEIPKADPRCTKTEFTRTKEQDHILGIFTRDEVGDSEVECPDPAILTPADPSQHSYEQITGEEVLSFNTNCPECNAPAETDMKLTSIPYFKEVVIMATTCDACGHRTNEVKSGGGIEPKGVRFEMRVAGKDDFSRDILKSETCSMAIPELEMEAGPHALSGRFTTTEGLLRAAAEQLAAPAAHDAASSHTKDKLSGFLKRLEEVLEGKRTVTLVLDDPAGNSYVQSLAPRPGDVDDGLKIVHYERSFDQNEELGLNDMKTEGYEQNS